MFPGERALRAFVCLAALGLISHASTIHATELPEPHAWNIYVSPPRPVTGVKLVGGQPSGCVDFHVAPEDTRVYVNGLLVGTVDEYDGWPDKLYLPEGDYRLRLNGPRGLAWRGHINVLAYHQVSVSLRTQ